MKHRANCVSLLLSVLVCLSMGLPTCAHSLSLDEEIEQVQLDVPRLKEIIRIVSDLTQPFEKRLHSEFWGLMLTRVRADPSEISLHMRRGFLEGLEYQREFWKSIELSVNAHRVVKTAKFATSERVQSKITAAYPDRERRMLEAAATGKPYVSSNGQAIGLDESAAQRAQARITTIEARLLRLIDPNWID